MTRHGRIHRGRRARRRPPGVSWPPLPQRNIPDATVHTSLVDMIAGYPHLTRSRQGRADPAGLRRVNSTSRLRWRLLQLISTGRSVLLRAALFAFLMSSSGSPPSRSGDDVPMRWGSGRRRPAHVGDRQPQAPWSDTSRSCSWRRSHCRYPAGRAAFSASPTPPNASPSSRSPGRSSGWLCRGWNG